MFTEPANLHGSASTEPDTVSVLLVGGPATFPDDLRRHRCSAEEPKVKIEHRGGHEHFERDDQTAGQNPVVYRWTTRTRIAE